MAFAILRPACLAVPLLLSLAGCADPQPSPLSLLDDGATPDGVLHEFDLYVVGGENLEVNGKHPFTLRFSLTPDGLGSIPAPEIRVTQGDTVRVRLHGGEHTIHWHGVRLPWGMDGVPDMTQTLGEGTFTYEFVAKDSGTFWYHCHVLAPKHIDQGMFGAFIVEPADRDEDLAFDREATLFLHEMATGSFQVSEGVERAQYHGEVDPEEATDVPQNPVDLVRFLQDNAATTTDDQLVYTFGQEPTRGYLPLYDEFMINGKSHPNTDPVVLREGETLRIRLVNAGALVHTMHLHGHRFLVTHKDGAELPQPYVADTIGMFPGERYDLYVLGDNPGHWDFHDHGGGWGTGAYAATDGFFPGGMMTSLVYEDWEMPALRAPSPSDGSHTH